MNCTAMARITLVLALLVAAPQPALAWGPAMHAYVNWKARQQARGQGVYWAGLDLQAYLAAAPAPDLWYAAEEAKLAVPGAIEEDWEYVRLMFAESKNLRQISFTLGYAGHIEGDVMGHRIYLAAGTGNDVHHLVRDTCSGFVLFGAHEGYDHFTMPADLVVGWGLGTVRGAGTVSGEWKWSAFDDEMLALMKRAADKWCEARAKKKGEAIKGCPVSLQTIGKLRDFQRFAVNTVAHTLSFPGYYADQSTAAANAKLVRGYDEAEWGAGKGPAMLRRGLNESVSGTVQRLFYESDIISWIHKAQVSQAQLQRFMIGPPPDGQDEREGLVAAGGCSVSDRPGAGALWLLALALLAWRRQGAR